MLVIITYSNIWVCLKIWYIPNEIAIQKRDNDQQNHWVFRGLAYFQTHPYGNANFTIPKISFFFSGLCMFAIHQSWPLTVRFGKYVANSLVEYSRGPEARDLTTTKTHGSPPWIPMHLKQKTRLESEFCPASNTDFKVNYIHYIYKSYIGLIYI